MRFFSRQFPNLTVTTKEGKIKFENGVYIAKNEKEIKILNDLGFPSVIEKAEKENKEIKKLVKKQNYKISKSWTLAKINKFAKEHNIDLPKNLTKNELIDYIESL